MNLPFGNQRDKGNSPMLPYLIPGNSSSQELHLTDGHYGLDFWCGV